jgi:hypothetical protein
VVAPSLSRGLWIGAAIGAVGLITALALRGERPDPAGLAHFEAAGVMLAIEPVSVTAVEIRRANRQWRFHRGREGGWATEGPERMRPAAAAALDDGLRFLHASAPQRVLAPDEVHGIPLSEYGLAPPGYAVTVRDGGTPFTVEFGAVNAQGLAQYARVAGREEIFLLPRFVGRQWETAIGPP